MTLFLSYSHTELTTLTIRKAYLTAFRAERSRRSSRCSLRFTTLEADKSAHMASSQAKEHGQLQDFESGLYHRPA